MTADITLRGPDEVIAVLPYQLGYHPRDSIVVVALDDRLVGMVARVDLPPDEHVHEVADALLPPLVREGVRGVVVITYEDVEGDGVPATLAVVEALEREGIGVVDVAVVRDGRRYSPVCTDGCCPSEGEPLLDPSTVPAVAELVARGRAPLAGREDVARIVDPSPSAEDLTAVLDLRASRRPGRRRWATAWKEVLAAGRTEPLRPQAVADAALSLADIAWRDGLVAWLSPGVLAMRKVDDEVLRHLQTSVPRWFASRGGPPVRTTDAPDLGDRLVELCRQVPDARPAEAVAVCTVAAHVAWAEGDGAVARAALDRAERLDPDYRLADLLRQLVDHGVRLRRGPGRPRGAAGLRSVG